jgi:hypothetical protein
MMGENGIDRVGDPPPLPTFCARISTDDDPSQVRFNFWAVEPTGDDWLDNQLGDLFGREAVQYMRERVQPGFLTCVLMFMGAQLLDDERCPGPLERAFIERVRSDCPEAVDHFFILMHKHHPERIEGHLL